MRSSEEKLIGRPDSSDLMIHGEGGFGLASKAHKPRTVRDCNYDTLLLSTEVILEVLSDHGVKPHRISLEEMERRYRYLTRALRANFNRIKQHERPGDGIIALRRMIGARTDEKTKMRRLGLANRPE